MMAQLTAKETREKALVAEYLEFCGQRFSDLRSLAEFCPEHSTLGVDGPDVKVNLGGCENKSPVGIELTEYQVDRRPMGSSESSPARKILEFNKRLNESLAQQVSISNSDLRGFSVRCDYDSNNLPKNRDLDALAAEFVDLLKKQLAKLVGNSRIVLRRSTPRKPPRDFDGHPLIKVHFSMMIIRHDASIPNGETIRVEFGNAGYVNIIPSELIRIINSKAQKRKKYDTSDVHSCWLLICASGETVADAAGPEIVRGTLESDAEIRRFAQQSGFDRVLFWERAHRWDCEI